jgi:isopenicillin N synthase-like dioxygenase
MPTPTAPPILDFSSFYGADNEAKARLVEEVRKCCHYNGFFQITGHRVPLELQRRVMECSKIFFNLPLEDKMQIDKSESRLLKKANFQLIRQI